MSEYQYYEWLAVDRPLTEAEMEPVASVPGELCRSRESLHRATHADGALSPGKVDRLKRLCQSNGAICVDIPQEVENCVT